MHKLSYLILVLALIGTSSCDEGLKFDRDLTEKDKLHIAALGLLAEGETFMAFSTQSTPNRNGSFATDKRLAFYYIDNDPTKSMMNFAYYEDIDSIKMFDRSRSSNISSYIEVYVFNSTKFRVFVGNDSVSTEQFFYAAETLLEWKKGSN